MMLGMAPTVFFLHGFTNTGASWDPVIGALGERYRALAPDIRGHGSATEARPVTLAAVIGDVAALAPERFTLVGYSQGGRIAVHAALALPDRVERMVLIGASPGIADATERAARRAADEALAAPCAGDSSRASLQRPSATSSPAPKPMRATSACSRATSCRYGSAVTIR
jgi:2-succinyl-6-hydroxy-2,4-cyclohexadiene-1-carboxylate synthase